MKTLYRGLEVSVLARNNGKVLIHSRLKKRSWWVNEKTFYANRNTGLTKKIKIANTLYTKAYLETAIKFYKLLNKKIKL